MVPPPAEAPHTAPEPTGFAGTRTSRVTGLPSENRWPTGCPASSPAAQTHEGRAQDVRKGMVELRRTLRWTGVQELPGNSPGTAMSPAPRARLS